MDGSAANVPGLRDNLSASPDETDTPGTALGYVVLCLSESAGGTLGDGGKLPEIAKGVGHGQTSY